MKHCEYNKCKRQAKYLMSWENKDDKHFGMVCATHDRSLGRVNLLKAGMPLNEIIAFEKYAKLTVDLDNYPDFPEWLRQYYETHFPSGTKRGQKVILQTI